MQTISISPALNGCRAFGISKLKFLISSVISSLLPLGLPATAFRKIDTLITEKADQIVIFSDG